MGTVWILIIFIVVAFGAFLSWRFFKKSFFQEITEEVLINFTFDDIGKICERILSESALAHICKAYHKAEEIKGRYYLLKSGKLERVTSDMRISADLEKKNISIPFKGKNIAVLADMANGFHFGQNSQPISIIIDNSQSILLLTLKGDEMRLIS